MSVEMLEAESIITVWKQTINHKGRCILWQKLQLKGLAEAGDGAGGDNMPTFAGVAKKLQTAINNKQPEIKILINTSQWYSEKRKRTITTYTVKQAQGKEKKTIQLFKTYSQIQLVLWLRDYWYTLNNWEVPHDNPEWEEVKAQNVL